MVMQEYLRSQLRRPAQGRAGLAFVPDPGYGQQTGRGRWKTEIAVSNEMTNLLQPLGYLLLVIAIPEFCYQCIVFVRQTPPRNYGNNPGFGCLEMIVRPWFLVGCVGTGLATQSLFWALAHLAAGFFLIGFLAQFLAHVFDNK
jgi:hypothetical protein